ncbi:MAG TPA: hypothetical protein VMT10_03560 [Solirubrobacteraceae bacterium]|nr:hypothetical protein [Solirubrobacteraceae bacterium]
MLRKLVLVPVLAASAALAVAGCGSGSSTTPPATPKPAAPAADFPAASAVTLAQLRSKYPEGPILAPSVSIMKPGVKNRFGFALFDKGRNFVNTAAPALYTAKPDGSGLRGPFPAHIESLKVRPAFLSQTSATDPQAARQVYVADVRFAGKGSHVVTGLARIGGKTLATTPYSIDVGGDPRTQPPGVGDKAIRVHTPTLASAGGNAKAIDTRSPPATDLLKTDLYDVLGKKPVVLTFATPQLCMSRVCGPVVDVVEQVANETGSGVAFIHNEIYKDNQISKGVRPQVAAYRLPSEPWTYVIDRNGIIRTRFEGAFSVGELERAVAQVNGGKA